MLLTEEQVEDFLTNKLKFDEWKVVLKDDQELFLKTLVRHYVNRVQFQNLSLAAVKPEERKNPSKVDILERGLNGHGGLCIELNYFIKLILNVFGIESFPVTISWSSGTVPGTHFGIVVLLANNRSYLIDVGGPVPFFDPVPLHQLPFQRVAGGYPFEFRRSPEGLIQRYQLAGSHFHGDFVGMSEELMYSFEPTPSSFGSFDPAMKFTYTDPSSFVPRQAFLFRQIISTTDLNATPDFIIVWARTIVKGFPGRVEKQEFLDYDEKWKAKIIEYFPYIIPEELDRAAENFKKFIHKELRYRY